MPLGAAVVTGVGVVCARADGPEGFWSGRHSAPAPGPALPIDPSRLRHEPRWGDVTARAGLDAAVEAWTAAGLPDPAGAGLVPARTGVVWGVGLSGLRALGSATAALREGRDPAPRDVLALSPAEPAAAIARRLGLTGPGRAVATACASGTDAIADAARLVRTGACTVVVAGGAEAGAVPENLAGLRRVGVLSPQGRARPFDRHRDGLVLAEAAAAVVVEDAGHAAARGAVPLARVLGAASLRDADGHPAGPGPDGHAVTAVLAAALSAAALDPGDLVAVDAHATGTVLGDEAEARGLVRLLGPGTVPVVAGKGATGHAMAAAGALDAVEMVLSLGHQRLAPAIGLSRPGDGAVADLDIVATPRILRPGPVASVSVGFGGFTSALVLGPG
jgi:3-oxoacyl-[acyl-carrier-protein] synthase II